MNIGEMEKLFMGLLSSDPIKGSAQHEFLLLLQFAKTELMKEESLLAKQAWKILEALKNPEDPIYKELGIQYRVMLLTAISAISRLRKAQPND